MKTRNGIALLLALSACLAETTRAQETTWAGAVHAGGTQVGLRLRLDGGDARFTVPHFG